MGFLFAIPEKPCIIAAMLGSQPMRSEEDLGQWLSKLEVGRAACVFARDVPDTLSVLLQAAGSARTPLRVVSLTWPEVPPLANELGLLVSALTDATLGFFPALYGRSQESSPARWAQSQVEMEARAITDALPAVDGTVCRKLLAAARADVPPSFGKRPRAELVRQLALAIEPSRLVVLVAVLTAPAAPESLKSLAQGVEWLADNSRSRVALVLPRALATRPELDHVTYRACAFETDDEQRTVVSLPEPGHGPSPRRPEGGPARARGAVHATDAPPLIETSPIEGNPANSAAEQLLHKLLTADPALRSLFAYNRQVTTTSGTTPRVDVLWETGKLAIEIDGADHRGVLKFSSDRKRDLELLLSGYRVVRFTEGSVIENSEWVMRQIHETVKFCRKRGAA